MSLTVITALELYSSQLPCSRTTQNFTSNRYNETSNSKVPITNTFSILTIYIYTYDLFCRVRIGDSSRSTGNFCHPVLSDFPDDFISFLLMSQDCR